VLVTRAYEGWRRKTKLKETYRSKMEEMKKGGKEGSVEIYL
jgi:hypothetical protein